MRQFGSSIDFTYPDVMRKSLVVYSVACNTPDALAERIRFNNLAQVCASVLRNSLKSHDFDLDDRFGDVQDLRHACSSISIPEAILRFLGYLYNFNPGTYPKAVAAVMMDTVPAEDDGDDESQLMKMNVSISNRLPLDVSPLNAEERSKLCSRL